MNVIALKGFEMNLIMFKRVLRIFNFDFTRARSSKFVVKYANCSITFISGIISLCEIFGMIEIYVCIRIPGGGEAEKVRKISYHYDLARTSN